MKCVDCEYFHIVQEPLRGLGGLYDMGVAECKKHNLVTHFSNHGKFKNLECVGFEEETLSQVVDRNTVDVLREIRKEICSIKPCTRSGRIKHWNETNVEVIEIIDKYIKEYENDSK